MRVDLKPGNTFPDIELPNHDNETVTLSSLVRGFPTVLVFSLVATSDRKTVVS